MSTRTTIRQTGPAEVTLRGTDPLTGGETHRVFTLDGYRVTERGEPVCEMLLPAGSEPLLADDGIDLLYTVRREWAAYRRYARGVG